MLCSFQWGWNYEIFQTKTWYFDRLLLLVWLVTCLQTNHHYITIYKDYVYSIPVYQKYTTFFSYIRCYKKQQKLSATHRKQSSRTKKDCSLRFEFCCPFRLGDGNSRSEWIIWRSGVNFNGPSIGYGYIRTCLPPTSAGKLSFNPASTTIFGKFGSYWYFSWRFLSCCFAISCVGFKYSPPKNNRQVGGGGSSNWPWV